MKIQETSLKENPARQSLSPQNCRGNNQRQFIGS